MVKKLLFYLAFILISTQIVEAQINEHFKCDQYRLEEILSRMTYQNSVLPAIPHPEIMTGEKQFVRKEPLQTEFNHFNQASLISYPLDLNNELKNSWSVKFKVKKTNFRYFLRP